MSSRRTISNTFTVTTMDEPVSVQAQYSPDKKVVHNVWQDGDIYMRTKQSNETTWSSWHKIVGESGGETDYQFALSANLVTLDGTSATAPSDISSSAWQDAPMATTTQKPYLWSKVQKKDGNGNNVGSATYIRLTGEKGKDGLSPNPNILLRTVFDRGIDKVKEKWKTDWSYVGIDESSDTIVDGRKSIRINASSLSTFKDFSQDVYGKLKTSTWYTLSFNFFSSHNFTTFIWDGDNSSGIVDRTAGCYIDGVFQSLDLGIDGSHEWTASWYNEKRHSISFKTKSSFGTAHAYILFRCPSGAQVAICMPKLELGENATTYIANEYDLIGNEGIRGKVGRFFYYAGIFDVSDTTTQFIVNDAQSPYFAYNNKYWVYNPENNPSGGTTTMSAMGTPSSSSSNWKLMTDDFKYIITEAIFGSYAHFGSFIINGDWMISQHGKKNNVDSTDYQSFDPNFAKGCYLCQGIDVHVQQAPVGSNVFIGGKTYTITLIGENFYADSGVTSKLNIIVRMFNGSSNVGNAINLTSANPTQILTFTPPSTGLYYVLVNMQHRDSHATITAYVNDVFVPNFAIDALQGTSYHSDAYLKGIIESENIDMGNKISIDAKNGAISMIGPTHIDEYDHKPVGNGRKELFRLDFYHDADSLTRFAMWRMNNGVTLKNWAYRELLADPYVGFKAQEGDYNDKYGRLSSDGVTISWGSSYGDKDVEISPEGVTIRRGSTYTTKTWEQIFNIQNDDDGKINKG